jgi:4-amino-4-deoxychorismate lyase
MSRFIESIRIAHGKIENLILHQERVNRALEVHTASSPLILEEHIDPKISLPNQVYKCRITYDLNGILAINYDHYQKRTITSLGIVRDNSIAYQHKYADRDHLNRLLGSSTADDIIIIKNGRVTDASYANLVFFDGDAWYTSNTPLLKGVQREQLIRSNTIQERTITEADIQDFSKIRLVNAMIPWEEALELPISGILR